MTADTVWQCLLCKEAFLTRRGATVHARRTHGIKGKVLVAK